MTRCAQVTCLVDLPDLTLIASCGLNTLIVLWDAQTGRPKRVVHAGWLTGSIPRQVLTGHTQAVTCMAFNSNLGDSISLCLLSGSFDDSILVRMPTRERTSRMYATSRRCGTLITVLL